MKKVSARPEGQPRQRARTAGGILDLGLPAPDFGGEDLEEPRDPLGGDVVGEAYLKPLADDVKRVRVLIFVLADDRELL